MFNCNKFYWYFSGIFSALDSIIYWTLNADFHASLTKCWRYVIEQNWYSGWYWPTSMTVSWTDLRVIWMEILSCLLEWQLFICHSNDDLWRFFQTNLFKIILKHFRFTNCRSTETTSNSSPLSHRFISCVAARNWKGLCGMQHWNKIPFSWVRST